ncbi:TetR/AcrR family transcriptional regulator [Specibacter sp. RAF43]|uniref:TetR/AcrR family transcriptional regulator n=1 Tax=Specibacter sp. RAF43 TaxID=3233057 RepID=UPI003F945019
MHSQRVDDRTLRLVWGVADPAKRGPQARFTVREVTTAACRLADVEGLPSVSLAKLANRLELTTTALYRYVDSKDALIDLMTDQAIGPPPNLDDQDWKKGAQIWVRELWLRYVHHRWLADVQVSGMPRHPNRLHWMNSLLLNLDRGAVPDPMHIALLLDSLARAFATLSPSPTPETQQLPAWLSSAILDRFPRLARELSRDWTDVEDELARAVDTVLARVR